MVYLCILSVMARGRTRDCNVRRSGYTPFCWLAVFFFSRHSDTVLGCHCIEYFFYMFQDTTLFLLGIKQITLTNGSRVVKAQLAAILASDYYEEIVTVHRAILTKTKRVSSNFKTLEGNKPPIAEG